VGVLAIKGHTFVRSGGYQLNLYLLTGSAQHMDGGLSFISYQPYTDILLIGIII
jgi:hypothetical protein